EEVPYVVMRRARLEQPRPELAPQVVKMQILDPSAPARRLPRGSDRRDLLADLVAEDAGVGLVVLPVRTVAPHFELRPEPRADRHGARRVGLRARCRQP